MTTHDLWHITVLGSTLFAAAGVAIVSLGPLLFETPPPGMVRARPIVLVLGAIAAVLLAVEWLGVH